MINIWEKSFKNLVSLSCVVCVSHCTASATILKVIEKETVIASWLLLSAPDIFCWEAWLMD